ncbi:hypothetical protein [Streptomyces ramulosus]|uniref:hypothetical protein n=1 Tax=Streptomyces TaxID=1883 RepID=UPI0031E60990
MTQPMVPAEALDVLPARWLLRVGPAARDHLDAGTWHPTAVDRQAATGLAEFLVAGSTERPEDLTEDRLMLLGDVSLHIGRLVDTEPLTPVFAETLLAFARALLPWMGPRGVWEPELEPYQVGSLPVMTRTTRHIRAAMLQLLDRITTAPDGTPCAPDGVPGLCGLAASIRIHESAPGASSVLLAHCPRCDASETLLLATDFSHVMMTCTAAHSWTDPRITASGWALGPIGAHHFADPPAPDIRYLGDVHVRYVP